MTPDEIKKLPTPETDAEENKLISDLRFSGFVEADFARTVEQHAEAYRLERDEIAADAIKFSSEIGRLILELDATKAELKKLRDIVNLSV